MNGTPRPSLDVFVDDGIGHSSYLVDLGDGTALAIDPRRIPELERAAAQERGLRIAFTADTHSHADFVSGSPELAAVGATFLAPAAAGLELPHHGLRDGDRVRVGNFALEAIGTPGHTPDHLAYVLRDTDDTPLALFSGGSLMVGTVGRTDLLGPDQARDLAHAQFHSLHDRILTLPDDLAVYPTHGAGSFCSAPGATERTTTIGHERARNPLLQPSDENEFVRMLLDGFGSFPPFFGRLPEVNRRGPRVYGIVPELALLDLDEFRAQLDDGAQLIDARPIAQFAAEHIPGALSIELRPVFATWLGWLVDPSHPVVFVLDDDQDRRDLVRQCLTVGIERIAGELRGGITTWRDASLPTTSTAVVTPRQVDGLVLDVRQSEEFVAGHVPGARNVELGALDTLDVGDLPFGHVTLMCGHGERAMTGASVLQRGGHTNLSVLVGAPSDWATDLGRDLAIGE